MSIEKYVIMQSVIMAEEIPAFLRETDNVDREFVTPETYLARLQPSQPNRRISV